MAELCREHDIAESLLRKWREQFLAAGGERLQGREERTEADELRRQIGQLERALGRKTLEVEVALTQSGPGIRERDISSIPGRRACASTPGCPPRAPPDPREGPRGAPALQRRG